MRGTGLRSTAAIVVIAALTAAITLPAGAIDDDDALRRAAHHLVRGQLEDGLFRFDLDFTTGASQGIGRTKNQNTAFIVRQAAAAYGLAKYYLATGDRSVDGATARAIQALATRSVPVGAGRVQRWIEAVGLHRLPWGRRTLAGLLDGLGLLYNRDGPGSLVAFEADYETAWIGGTALALIAELHYAAASGDERFAAQRRSWLTGIMALHVDGAGFREYPASIEESPLAHGEIWLALSFLPAPDLGVLDGRREAIDRYLLTAHTAAPTHLFFHWAMMAVAQRGPALDAGLVDRLVVRLTRHVLDTLPAADLVDDNSCTVVEGLAAAAQVLRRTAAPNAALLAEIEARIAVEMAKNRAMQIGPGQSGVVRADGGRLAIAPDSGAEGAFLASRARPFIRVDFTSHCISALIEMRDRRAGQ